MISAEKISDVETNLKTTGIDIQKVFFFRSNFIYLKNVFFTFIYCVCACVQKHAHGCQSTTGRVLCFCHVGVKDQTLAWWRVTDQLSICPNFKFLNGFKVKNTKILSWFRKKRILPFFSAKAIASSLVLKVKTMLERGSALEERMPMI